MISNNLQENKIKIKELFNNSSDLVLYEFQTLADDMALVVFLAIAIVIIFGSLGVEQSRNSNFPFLLYVRTLKDVKILGRVDPVFVVGWLIINLLRIVGLLYLVIRAISEVFNKNEKDKVIVYIVGAISGLISILILNQRSVIGIRKEFNLFYGILFVIFVIVIPILTCLIYFFRKKSINEKMESQNKKGAE